MDIEYMTFKNPPLDFYLCPWWCWNGEMDEKEIVWQLRQFKEHGIPQVFIAPYYGLDFPYLSETFWKKYEFAVKEAAKLGMRIWLYDEYCWPSGNAGGILLRDEPWTRGKTLAVSLFAVSSGQEANVSVEEEILALRAFTKDLSVTDVKDHKAKREGFSIQWKNTTGKDCTLLVFATRVTQAIEAFSYGSPWTWDVRGYVDTLNPEAVKRFVELTHEEYAKRFKDYIGTMIPAIFTDEVHMIMPDHKDAERWYFPYTENFLESFEKEKGYSLIPKIHELVLPMGDYIKTRYDFWGYANRVYSESYYKQIYEWCAEHRISLTGHPLGEEFLRAFMIGGDIWCQTKYMQIPGLDRLGLTTGYDAPAALKTRVTMKIDPKTIAVGSKTVCSSAKFTGAKRVLSEVFGEIPWSCSLEDKKRVIDWLCSMGVSLINDNKHQYSIRGFRKRYYSHGMYFSVPYFGHYHLFSEYVARLCLLAASDGEGTEIATLYPSTTAWTIYDTGLGGKPQEDFALAEESLQQVTNALLREQWANDYLYEEVLEKTEIKWSAVKYRDLIYKALILPSAAVLPESVLSKVVNFAKEGGLLVFLNLLPSATPEGRIDVRKAIKDTTDVDPCEHNAEVLRAWLNREKEPNVHKVKRKGNVAVITHIGDPLKLETELTNLLREKLQRYIEIIGPNPARRNFVSCHRRNGGHDFFFLSNLNEESVKANVKLKARGPIQIWNLEDGSVGAVSSSREKEGVSLAYTFPRSGSVLFAVGGQNVENNLESPHDGVEKRIPLSSEWFFSTETPNICRLKLQALACENDEEKESIIRGFDEAGAWITLVDDIFLPEGLKLKSAKFWWLRAKVIVDISPKGISLVVDDKNYDKVYVNGKKLIAREPVNVWDRGNIKIKLDGHLKSGENTFVIGVSYPEWWSENVAPRQAIDPIVLVGRFEVQHTDYMQKLTKCEAKKKTGSWHEQGYPFYSGTGIYEQTIKLSKLEGRVFLEMEGVKETVKVLVNNKPAGIRVWPPFRVEITDFLIEGNNSLTLNVSNTLENLFEKPYPSGLTGPSEIVIY